MSSKVETMKHLLWIVAIGFLTGGCDTNQDASFRPNGTVFGDVGAAVCPDSPHARAGLKDKNWEVTHEDFEKMVQANDPKIKEVFKPPDLTGDGCSSLVSGTPVYIESSDATKISVVTAKLPDGTMVHGITRSDMVQRAK